LRIGVFLLDRFVKGHLRSGLRRCRAGWLEAVRGSLQGSGAGGDDAGIGLAAERVAEREENGADYYKAEE